MMTGKLFRVKKKRKLNVSQNSTTYAEFSHVCLARMLERHNLLKKDARLYRKRLRNHQRKGYQKYDILLKRMLDCAVRTFWALKLEDP